MSTKKEQEVKAVKVGKLDAVLSVIFVVAGIAVIELLSWLITVLPVLDSYEGGKYVWLKIPIGILIGAVLKGVDRKKHEDPTPSNGLIDVEV